MKSRLLGRTRFQVSEIGFGCWALGGSGYGPTRDECSLEALEAAWQQGVNFFDTADTYGHGHSETLVGRFLSGKPRDRFRVATKVGWDFYHGGSRKNFDPDYIRFACDESLKRLDLETIDLYQLHNPSLEVLRRGDAVGALEELKRLGKILSIGVSIHTEDDGLLAIHDGRVDVLQVIFNLLNQRVRGRLLDEAKKRQIGIIAREPLAFGFLTGKYGPDHVFHKDDHRRRFMRETLEANARKVDRLRELLAGDRASLTQASLEYVLGFDQISTVIPGAKTADQVNENVRASATPVLETGELERLRRLWDEEEIFQANLF